MVNKKDSYWSKLWKKGKTDVQPIEEYVKSNDEIVEDLKMSIKSAVATEPTIVEDLPTEGDKEKILSLLDKLTARSERYVEDAIQRRDTTDHILYDGHIKLIAEIKDSISKM